MCHLIVQVFVCAFVCENTKYMKSESDLYDERCTVHILEEQEMPNALQCALAITNLVISRVSNWDYHAICSKIYV